MAITLVQKAKTSGHTTAGTINLTSTPVVGNILIIRMGTFTAGTITPPTGFTQLNLKAPGGSPQYASYYRVVQGGDGTAYNFGFSVSMFFGIDMREYSGVNLTNPFDAAAASALINTQTLFTTPASISPTYNTELAISAFTNGTRTTGTPAAGWVEDQFVTTGYFIECQVDSSTPAAGVALQGSMTWGGGTTSGFAELMLLNSNPTPSSSLVVFNKVSALSQNVTLSLGSGTYSITTPPNAAIATASLATNVLTINPVGVGTTTVVIGDSISGTCTITIDVAGSMLATPTTLTFVDVVPSLETLEVELTKPFFPNLITATIGNTAIASVSPASASGPGPILFTVTGVSDGQTTLTFTEPGGDSQTVTINVFLTPSIQPTSLAFSDPISPANTLTITSGIAPFTATSSNNAIATASVVGNIVTVTPVNTGSCTITVKDSGGVVITAPVTVGLPLSASPTQLTFTSPASSPQTITASAGATPYSAMSTATSIATVGIVGATVTVTPVAAGSCNVKITDADGEIFLVTISIGSQLAVTPTSMTFTSPTASPQTIAVSGGSSPYTAASSNPAIATASIVGGTVTVTPVSTGTVVITVQDSTLRQALVTCNVSSAPSNTLQSLVLKFTGFVETDAQHLTAFQNDKTVTLLDLTKQFRFPVYDTLPHPLYGDQNLTYFDPTYNLVNSGNDGVTWVCPGKMFSVSAADLVYGSGHIDPLVYVDTTGGLNPTSTPLSNAGYTITGTVGTCPLYTFNYTTGTVVLTNSVPPTSVVSVAGNPTYMAPETMIYKLLVEKAGWNPNFLLLDSSNILLPQYVGQDQPIWQCISQIAQMTNPRLVPWIIWCDENGVIRFFESRVDGPPVASFLDERDILDITYEYSSRDLRTVVRADGLVATQQGDQPITSIAYDIEALNKYGQTEAQTVDQIIADSVRNLPTNQAVSYLNMLTASILATVSRPMLQVNAEIWPNPTLQIGDKIKVKSKRVGSSKYFTISAINDDIQEGEYKMVHTWDEFYEPINYLMGTPAGVSKGNTQGSITPAPSTALIGAVRMGTGVPMYPFQYGQMMNNQQTGEPVVPNWNLSDPRGMDFSIYLNSIPAVASIPLVPTQTSIAGSGAYSYYNLPPGYGWGAYTNPTNNEVVFYGKNPNNGFTLYVGPDSIFYTFNHPAPIQPTDTTIWTPPAPSKNPTFTGGVQGYTGTASTCYLWTYWYLCLDSNIGTGKNFRLVQRPNASQDAQPIPVGASAGVWITNKWNGNPGPDLVNPSNNYLYGNIAVGINNIYPTPPGFVGANVMGDGVNLGVAFGASTSPGNFYVGYGKKTRGHFCVFAANNFGAVQFLRIPFNVVM